MGKYTVYDDQWIDEQIQTQLDVVVKHITAALPDREISIVLSGGFGRGEGSVIASENHVAPLKDYDIWILSNPKIPVNQCDLIQNSIYQELGLTNPENESFRFSRFVIDIESTTIDNLNLYPDIFSYELKEASTLLYGEDVRDQIVWTSQDVPIMSGLRLLFQKVVGLIGHFRLEYLSGPIDPGQRLQYFYECYKTYVEIATALCISMGCYEPSFASRARLFKQHFRELMPDLCAEVPGLSDLVIKSTNFKLRPNLVSLNEDPVLLWDRTRTALGKVLRTYLNLCLDIQIDDWINLPQRACRKMGNQYYKPIANAYAIKRLGTTNDVLSTLLTTLYQKRLGYAYARRIKDEANTSHWRTLLHACAPIILIYLTAPLVLYSLSTTGETQKSYFDAARVNLRRLTPMLQVDEGSNWNDLRSAYLFVYDLSPGPGGRY